MNAGMQLFQWLSVEFHVPPISNCPDHFKQSLLKSPTSSFSWKILISQQCLLATTFNILRVLKIRNILSEKLCLILLAVIIHPALHAIATIYLLSCSSTCFNDKTMQDMYQMHQMMWLTPQRQDTRKIRLKKWWF